MPVLVTIFSELRSVTSRGLILFLATSNIHLGLMPSFVTRCSPRMRMNDLRSGTKGEPSYITTRAPDNSAATLARYMIQPVVVYCRVTDSGDIDSCRRPSLKLLSMTPPTVCTIALGIPVVPDE